MTTLVYFAPVRWDSYLQRPHYLVRYFLARGGTRVVWIDPYPTRFPMWSDVHRREAGASLQTPRPDAVTVIAPRALPIEPLRVGQQLNRQLFGRALLKQIASMANRDDMVVGIGRPSSLALDAVTALRPGWTFFDALDDFPEFYRGLARKAVAEVERRVAASVDSVLTPSTALWNKFAAIGERRRMVRNACDMRSLPPFARRPADPPVVGFVGCISTWFDWDLVDRLAREAPHARVEIVGPCFERPSRPLAPNLALFPACGHEQAIDYMARFTIGLIPFKRNQLTDGVDPIKYYEYRGLGMPVLSTRFGEMAGRSVQDGVYFAEEPGSLAVALASATAAGESADWLDAFRRDNSWERRFADARLFE